MAFSSLGNNANSLGGGAGGGNGGVIQGPDLELIQTEALGFLSLAGDAKVRLTSPWSPFPAQNASLLSIAPRKGLVAAAGPDAVVVATTETVRKAFEAQKTGDSEVRSFEPQLKIPMPIRICQLAFTADENFLIMSAEQGGGLAVYEVDALLQGTTQPSFQITTNNEALRALIPNPSPEKAELCAVVTDKGNLLIASMKTQDFVPGKNGQVLKNQVSCSAWSTRGKQLVAGIADGTIQQMTPEGDVKAEIPRPPDLDPNYFVSFLAWLENDVFLAVHVCTSEEVPQSKYHLITRQGQSFAFQKLTDPVEPFGIDKVPHHTAARLKDFPPNLQDLLIFSSTASSDIGLLTRSKAPLSSEFQADKITNVFTTTELADDSKRATLPVDDSYNTPAPIGAALDLSSKDAVYKPIPTEEMEYSPGPLPSYWVLNEEGVLAAWWVVYTESVRGNITYPLLAAAQGNAASSSAPVAAATQPNKSNPFSTASSSNFRAPAATSTPAFGGASALGSKPSPWGSTPSSAFGSGTASGGATFGSSAFGSAPATTTPKFGTPSFGQTAPAFGQSTGLGGKASPWGALSSTPSAPAFGQSGLASAGTAAASSPFGGATGTSTASPFASFANKGGFAQAANSGTNIFASSKPETADTSMDTTGNTSFPPPSSKPATGSGNPFGAQPFKLTSSFQPDPNAKDDNIAEEYSSGGKSIFGHVFSSALGTAEKPKSTVPFGQPASTAESTTPTTTPAPSKFLPQTSTAPQNSGIFSLPSKPASNPFGTSAAQAPATETPKVKDQSQTHPSALDAPLPPDSTSKASYPFGESSSSSENSAGSPDTRKTTSDAPLPPDFSSSTPKPTEKLPPPPDSPPAADDAPLPPDPAKNKKAYDVKFDPLPGEIKPKPKSSFDDAPLPPDPMSNKKAYHVKFQPVPGMQSSQPPPKPQGKPQSVFESTAPKSSEPFVFPSNPPPVSDSEEDEESGEYEEDEDTEAASEGSGVDVAKDLSPPSGPKDKTPGFTPTSSFDGLGGSFSTIGGPEPERKSLFGAPVLPRPNPISPRSPSPVRDAAHSRFVGSDQPRSFSAPGIASHLLGASKRPQSRLGPPITGKDIPTEDPRIEQQRKARAKRETEESQPLLDDEEEERKKLLNEMKPTLKLNEFVAHTGPAPRAGDSIPAQVESVYKDINAMIDMLGLNARSLANFIQGHAETYRHQQRDKNDLLSPEDWTIGELQDLSNIISRDLVNELEGARVVDVEEKIAKCQDLQRELARDRNKRNDLEKIINSRVDPDQALANRQLPLTAEQSAQQNDLRRDFARFTKLLTEVEEDVSLLKAKIVSTGAASGKGGPTPTIEAVMRTITKMTTMIEKRSGDVDVLETQMRKLQFNSPGLNNSTRSRENSPFSTPKSAQKKLMFSPERSMRESTPQRTSLMRQSMNAVGSIGGGMFAVRTPPRKKLSGYTDAEKKDIKERKARRGLVLGKLKASLEKKGPNVWQIENIH